MVLATFQTLDVCSGNYNVSQVSERTVVRNLLFIALQVKLKEEAWKKMLKLAQGEKILDNPQMLRKSIKKEGKLKAKKQEAWANRTDAMKMTQGKTQQKCVSSSTWSFSFISTPACPDAADTMKPLELADSLGFVLCVVEYIWFTACHQSELQNKFAVCAVTRSDFVLIWCFGCVTPQLIYSYFTQAYAFGIKVSRNCSVSIWKDKHWSLGCAVTLSVWKPPTMVLVLPTPVQCIKIQLCMDLPTPSTLV